MYNFTVISVGRLKEQYFIDAAAEYVKRIGGFSKINTIELKDDIQEEKVTANITANTPAGAYVFALCIEGRRMTSEKFADELNKIYLSEKKGVCFIIGGAEGLPDKVKKMSDSLLSMSDMTFPHRLAKIMLLEQIYRALSIQNNRSYHRS